MYPKTITKFMDFNISYMLHTATLKLWFEIMMIKTNYLVHNCSTLKNSPGLNFDSIDLKIWIFLSWSIYNKSKISQPLLSLSIFEAINTTIICTFILSETEAWSWVCIYLCTPNIPFPDYFDHATRPDGKRHKETVNVKQYNPPYDM